MIRCLFIMVFMAMFSAVDVKAVEPEFSTAGFFEMPNTGREVYSMNSAWRFFKGNVGGEPWKMAFDDSHGVVVWFVKGEFYSCFC